MIYIIFLLIVILEGTEDGLRELGYKKWSKRSEGLYKALFCIMPFFIQDVYTIHSWTEFIGSLNRIFQVAFQWVLIRTYLFDPVMHTISGWTVNTVGITTPIYDRFMKLLPGWKVWAWRSLACGMSIFWYYKVIV